MVQPPVDLMSRRADAATMFIIELTYVAALTEIDRAMRKHMVFLNEQYEKGIFIASGRKVPREGGIILATGRSREEIESLMERDPFCSQGLATYRVVEFRVSQRAPDVQALLDAEPSR